MYSNIRIIPDVPSNKYGEAVVEEFFKNFLPSISNVFDSTISTPLFIIFLSKEILCKKIKKPDKPSNPKSRKLLNKVNISADVVFVVTEKITLDSNRLKNS